MFIVRRFKFVKVLLLVVTLCLIGFLFVSFNQPYPWQERETKASKSVDKYAHITSNPMLLSSTTETPDNDYIYNTKQEHFGDRHDTLKYEAKDGCAFPDIDPFAPEIMALTKIQPPISCEGGVPHLVYANMDTIRVNHSKTSLVGDSNNIFKECTYKTIGKKPGSDFQTVVLYTSQPFNDSITLRDSDDNLVVECYSNHNTVLSRSYFSLIRVKKDLELLLEGNFKKHVTLNAPKEVFNVLMIGIDANSKQNFQRHMPKTRDFLLKNLNAIELHKYVKMGENTFPNIIPLLTGKPWTYLLQLNWTQWTHFDHVNDKFIWSDYHKAGYRTGAFFDEAARTAFHNRKRGWDKPPVDYYNRASIVQQKQDKPVKGRELPHCVGDTPEITHNLDFWIQMASIFNNSQTKPFFGFSFCTLLTNGDNNMASAGDDLYLRFLKELRDKNVHNNTVIVFFSDHGERFGDLRKTYYGMIESRTPYVFLVFPPWFHQKYPDLMKTLRINQERLTTNTDVYETLRNLLNFQAETSLGDINKKGISLFQEIPRERTCEHAGIGAQYCVCNNFIPVNVSSQTAQGLASAVQDRLKQLIYEVREICQEFVFHSFHKIFMAMPSNTTDNTETKATCLYRAILFFEPSRAMFEATVEFSDTTKTFKVTGDISRLTFYRGQDGCINDNMLKDFCYCKK